MPEPSSKVSMAFLVITIAVAAIVGIAIVYLGVTGKIGGPIP